MVHLAARIKKMKPATGLQNPLLDYRTRYWSTEPATRLQNPLLAYRTHYWSGLTLSFASKGGEGEPWTAAVQGACAQLCLTYSTPPTQWTSGDYRQA